MNKLVATLVLLSFFAVAVAQEHVSNIRVQVSDEQLLIMYDLSVRADIEVYASFDGGATFRGPLQHVSGAAGRNIAPEQDKVVIWYVIREFGEVDHPNAVIKIVATTSDQLQAVTPQSLSILTNRKGNPIGVADANSTVLNRKDMRGILQTQPDALKLYNRACSQSNWALVLAGISGGLMGGSLGFFMEDMPETGVALLLSGVGIYIGALQIIKSSNKKVVEAVDMYNSRTVANKPAMELKFGIKPNGIGVALTF